jgi:dTDP-4-dehydrorhamnose 3,5-epimerase
MHYQYPPKSEVKIVICLRGRVFDVAVDLRKGSQTFLGWHGEELSEDNNSGMYIPKGFAHGFQALEEHCELLYFHTEYYLPEFEGGVRYDDEAINIQWPRQPKNVSQRDMSHPKIHLTEFGGLEL